MAYRKHQTPKQKYVIYKRLSTTKERQTHSFEVQDRIIKSYLNDNPHHILATFEEELSGAKNDRPMLAKALEMCKAHDATLLVAKLDRLSRDVGMVDKVVKNYDLICADMPKADKTMLQMLSVMAEWERDAIAKRISDGVLAAIARGKRPGNRTNHKRKLTTEDSDKGRQTRTNQKQQRMAQLQPQVKSLYNNGERTMAQVADMLNGLGVPTTGKGKWYANTVKRILDFDVAVAA
ncbi:recombinase family protein [Ferrimonas lipolytica]|uniref:Recombinase family protein n=1 Tax=Ferrimonas lipolytica TaxID=2724191 RepID=A0A6H1UHH9_9GAMM|nr:recombinase family protein [Ferrimonas lipolytica]QIZ78060.1 recombinase family protein [Ferrimonas lipolytica]